MQTITLYEQISLNLNILPYFSLHLTISVCMSIIGLILAAVWPYEKKGEAYFIMTCLRVAFWLITFVSEAKNYSVISIY